MYSLINQTKGVVEMNRYEYDRISNILMELPNTSGDWMSLVMKAKQLEILERINKNLDRINNNLSDISRELRGE